jgi:hypothetical protein
MTDNEAKIITSMKTRRGTSAKARGSDTEAAIIIPEDDILVALYAAWKKRAQFLEKSWGLSYGEFVYVLSKSCFYCSAPPYIPAHKNSVLATSFVDSAHGLDTLNEQQGFVFVNVVPACPVCRRARGSMAIQEFFKWLEGVRRPQGEVELEKITDKHGNAVDFEEACRRGWLSIQSSAFSVIRHPAHKKNMCVDQSRQISAYCLGFRSPISSFTIQKFGVGTGLTPPKVTDVALESPVTLQSGQILKTLDSIEYPSPFVLRATFTLGLGDANGYSLTEFGLFTGGDALFARKVDPVAINKTSDFSPTLSWRIRF